MKHKTIFFIAALLISLLLCFSNAQAEVLELGDVCFILEREGSFGPGSGSRVSVLSYGLDHFVLNGIIGGGTPAHGTALLNDNNVIISLTTTYVSPDLIVNMFSLFHITLNLTTGTGTYKEMFTQTLPAPSQSGTISGTVTLSTCSP